MERDTRDDVEVVEAEEERRKAAMKPLGERGAVVLRLLRDRPCQTGAELARAAGGVFPTGAVYATLQRLERQKRIERRQGIIAPFYVATTAGMKALTLYEFDARMSDDG
jgi:DNA-binding PadR family transcriptional regulator